MTELKPWLKQLDLPKKFMKLYRPYSLNTDTRIKLIYI